MKPLALLALAALWAPALTIGFLSDDFALREAVLRDGPFGAWHTQFFRPLTSLLWWLDARIWGPHAPGYHLTNLALHAWNSVAVGLLAGRLALPRPWIAGAAFAAWGSHVESVAWISGRTDLLATGLALAALLGILSPDRRARAAGTVAFAASLLAKESPVTLPLVALMLAGRRSLPWFAVVAAWLVVRRLALGAWLGGYGAEVHGTLEPARFVEHAWALVLPTPGFQSAALEFVAPVLVFAALGQPRLLAAAGCLVLPGLTMEIETWSGAGSRLAYLPSVFTAMAAASLAERGPPARALLGVLVVLHAVGVGAKLGDWRAGSRLAERVLADIVALPASERALVLTLPDSVDGVYILRNGALSAWRLAHPGAPPPRVTVAGTWTSCSADGAPTVSRVRTRITAVAENPCTRFRGAPGSVERRDDLTIRLDSPERLVVEVRDPSVAVYREREGGGLTTLP